MTTEKLTQYIALFGGLLSAALLFLQTLGVIVTWFTNETIDASVNALLAAVPFILVVYGIYKNTYLLTKKARVQEKTLKSEGLK